MRYSTFQLDPEILLDARRAVFVHETQTLAVADLHLGYAWAHRHGGQLLPVSAPDDTLPRLLDLVQSYEPRELVLLGDIVHRAVPLEALKKELCEIFDALNDCLSLVFVAGNHDRNLQRLFTECGVAAELTHEFASGCNLFVHGDAARFSPARRDEILQHGGRVFIGHEHPAISVSDGVATSAKCSCFLVSGSVVILPAFSRWAAGTDVRSYPRSSPWALEVEFGHAVAILGGRLLPVAL